MPPTQDEKNAKLLRDQIAKIPENKRCADCTAKGPVYANTTFHTFICTACSGIHREFNHRVKSISMASFKPEEMKGLLEGGNAVARSIWMAKWSASDFPEPDPGDPDRLRQFIRLKYIDKKWASSSSSPAPQKIKSTVPSKPSSSVKGDIPRAEPLTNILGNNIPPIQVNPVSSQPSSPPKQDWAAFGDSSWTSTNPTPTPAPSSTSAPSRVSFWENPTAQPTNHSSSTGLEGLLLPSSDQVQKIEAEKAVKAQEEQAKKKSSDLLANLGNMYQQQAAANQQTVLVQQQQMIIQMAQGFPQPQQQMFLQMAQSGLNLQQQQLLLQQMQMMKAQFAQPAIPVVPAAFGGQPTPGVPFSAPGGFPQSFGAPVQPAQQGGFGMSTSPTSFGVMSPFGAVPTSTNPYPQEPVKPAEPAKPDPFAALSPFAVGAKSSSAPAKPTSPPKSNDPFGADPFSVTAPQVRAQEVNPFGISQPANVQPSKQDDFNPFF